MVGADTGLKTHLVRIIANMSFECPEVQDLVRERGGLHLVLNHFLIDENNPFLREWSILAVRNLTDNNIQNQEVISQLQIIDVPQNVKEDLNTIGFELKFNPNGKINVVKMQKDEIK